MNYLYLSFQKNIYIYYMYIVHKLLQTKGVSGT